MIDTKHWQDKLEREKAELENQLKTVGRPNPNQPGDWEPTPLTDREEAQTRDDIASELEEMDEREDVELGLEKRLKQIQAALARIQAGTYGTCEIGGEEIEAERLEANPAARTCKAHIEQEADLN